MKNRKWWQSSDNAKELSRTVTGFFTAGVIMAIVIILSFFGIDMTVDEANTIIEIVGLVITNIGVFGGYLYGLYGVIRKIINNNK